MPSKKAATKKKVTLYAEDALGERVPFSFYRPTRRVFNDLGDNPEQTDDITFYNILEMEVEGYDDLDDVPLDILADIGVVYAAMIEGKMEARMRGPQQ